MYTSICWYLRVLPVLHRPEAVDIGVNTIKKNMPYATRTIYLSIQYVHGDVCKHLGIYSSTDRIIRSVLKSIHKCLHKSPLFDRYSNLFLNAYINCHAHTESLNMIEVYSPCGMFFFIVFTPISTTSGL